MTYTFQLPQAPRIAAAAEILRQGYQDLGGVYPPSSCTDWIRWRDWLIAERTRIAPIFAEVTERLSAQIKACQADANTTICSRTPEELPSGYTPTDMVYAIQYLNIIEEREPTKIALIAVDKDLATAHQNVRDYPGGCPAPSALPPAPAILEGDPGGTPPIEDSPPPPPTTTSDIWEETPEEAVEGAEEVPVSPVFNIFDPSTWVRPPEAEPVSEDLTEEEDVIAEIEPEPELLTPRNILILILLIIIAIAISKYGGK